MELSVNKEPKDKVDIAMVWIWLCLAVMAVIKYMRGNKSNKWFPELTEGSTESLSCHFNTGADLLKEMYNQIMPVPLILNLHWGTAVKILYYYNFITLAIRISWNSVRIISCLCGILEMQK